MSINQTNLFLRFKSSVIHINDIFLNEKINEHGFCMIDLFMSQKEKFELVSSIDFKTEIAISYMENTSEIVLFYGIPKKVKIMHIHNLIKMCISLESSSIKLDIFKKCRSFQNTNDMFRNLFQSIVVNEYGGEFLDIASNGAKQNDPFIQYNETDWEFLKRMASQLNTVIVTEATREKPNIYLGCPTKTSYLHDEYHYEIVKDLEKYGEFKVKLEDWNEEDSIEFIIDSSLDYSLCDVLIFKDIPLQIVQKSAKLKKGVIIFTYMLKKQTAIKQPKIYNDKLKGISIEGKVLEVQTDKVKLHFNIDKEQNKNEAYFYPFSSPYTAEDSTGMYCMPQIGDSAILFIPDNFEANAYVQHIRRLDGDINNKTSNPDIKYFGTFYAKEIKMSPEELKFSVKEEQIYINMSDSDGILLHSKENISVEGSTISIGADNITMKSEDKIVLSTNKSSLIVDRTIHLNGGTGIDIRNV